MSQTTDAANAAADTKPAAEFGEDLEETLSLLTDNTLAGLRSVYTDLAGERARHKATLDKIESRVKELGQELKRVTADLRTAISEEVLAAVAEDAENGDPATNALAESVAGFLAVCHPGLKGIDLLRNATALDASIALQRLLDAYDRYQAGDAGGRD